MRKKVKDLIHIARTILLIWVLFIGASVVFSEEYGVPNFEKIDRESGLSNASVSSIVQDRYGFLWFGTQGGLNRYDGQNMEIYRNDPFSDAGLVHNLIQTMTYDESEHQLWIGTYQGISQYVIEENRFINWTVEDQGLSNPVVIAIEKTADGLVWAGTMKGLNRLDPTTGEVRVLDVPGDVVRSLFETTEGHLLVGTYEGLFQVEGENLVPLSIDLPSFFVMTIDSFDPDELTLGLWDGGVVVLSKDYELISKWSLADQRVYAVEKMRDGSLWVATWGGGIFRISEDGTVDHYNGEGKNSALDHKVGYSLLEDSSGILWIGTNGGGIFKMNPTKRNSLYLKHDPDDPDSLSSGKVNSLLEDREGNLWISVYNSGVHRYDPRTGIMSHYEHDPEDASSLPNNQVVALLEYQDRVLLGTNSGLAIYQEELDSFQSWDLLPEGTLVYALEDDRKGGLWIGTYHQGLYHLDANDRLTRYHSEAEEAYRLSDNLVYQIVIGEDETVWVATNNGLNKKEKGEKSFRVYKKTKGDRNQLASNTIRTLFMDSDHDLWIGMVGGGLARYLPDTDQFQSFTEKEGLGSNVVSAISEDRQGRIWASTHNGLSVLNKEGLILYHLAPDDGIGGFEFTGGALLDQEGRMLFGGSHGVTAIEEVMDLSINRVPELYITDVQIFQDSLDSSRSSYNGSELTFEPDETFVGFEFVALDYDVPEQVRYAYRLVGFDDEWIDAGTRRYTSFSNLPPGRYRFEVKALTAREVEAGPVFVSFEIRTPLYQTTEAYLFYAFLGFLLLYVLLKLREGQLVEKRNEELGLLNNKLEKANEELEKLSTTDALTGLYNRHYFNTVAEELLFLAKRSQAPLAILMMDIDGFKMINDTYGHVAGDEYLKAVGQLIGDQLPRSTDFAARYGGDEFVVVLFNTDYEGALHVAKRLDERAAAMEVTVPGLKGTISTTLSIGLTSIVPGAETTLDSIVQESDRALYENKRKRSAEEEKRP